MKTNSFFCFIFFVMVLAFFSCSSITVEPEQVESPIVEEPVIIEEQVVPDDVIIEVVPVVKEEKKAEPPVEKKPEKQEPPAPDVQGRWNLVSFEKKGVAQKISDAYITVAELLIGSYRISGFSGVNTFSGNIKANGQGNIVHSKIQLDTKKNLPADKKQFERDLIFALTNADRLELGEILRISDSKHEIVLEFKH